MIRILHVLFFSKLFSKKAICTLFPCPYYINFFSSYSSNIEWKNKPPLIKLVI